MRRRAVGVFVCCLLLAASGGCIGLSGALESPTESQQRHPFAGETVTVTVDGTDRERALVAAGLQYWQGNASEYAGFPVAFRLVESGTTPASGTDVHIRFRETVTACGESTYPAGCAPRLNASTGVDRPAVVQIERGFADDPTVLVVQHEVGHLLGLGHDDRPHDIMNHRTDLATLPQTNATERPVPWNDTTLTVAIDNETVPAGERERYAEELAYALAYADEGADGAVPSNVSVRQVPLSANPDVTIRAGETPGCDADSCLFLGGTDPDHDGAIETYTDAEIRLIALDTDAVSWHAARQLLGVFGTDDVPDRLDGANAAERRGDWHG